MTNPNAQRFVRVPEVVVKALIAYLIERPYKEVKQFLDIFEGMPIEQEAPATPTPPNKPEEPKS